MNDVVVSMYNDITGIILSGGFSSRIGQDKALLKYGDETLIQRLLLLLKTLFNEVMIITNTPSDYKFLNVPLYEDVFKHKGPLAGIHSGLLNSNTEKNFIVSCDTPLINIELIDYLIKYKSNKPVRFFADSFHEHPLIGVYSKTLLPQIENVLISIGDSFTRKDKSYSIKNFLNTIEHEIIQIENLPFYSEQLFFNVNTQEDYFKLKEFL